MSWSNRYIGTPEATCSCWELVRRVYAAEQQIDLPAYEGVTVCAAELAEIAALVDAEERRQVWRRVPAAEARPFDVLLFRRGRLRSHVGLVVDRRWMLHMRGQARLDAWQSGEWASRLAGVYRHVEAPVEGPGDAGAEGTP